MGMCFEWMFTYVVKPPKNRPWDLLGWTPVIADENYPDWKETHLRELNNGRLAMIGFVGLVAQDLYTGSATALVGAAASVILANNRKQGRKTSLSDGIQVLGHHSC